VGPTCPCGVERKRKKKEKRVSGLKDKLGSSSSWAYWAISGPFLLLLLLFSFSFFSRG
jgi:hypothetical protein